MKKILIFSIAIVMISMGCSKMFGGRQVQYSVSSAQGQSGEIVYVSYINEDGENEFAEVQPGFTWGWSGDFQEGDWVRVQAQCSAKTGSMQIRIKCDDGDNEKVFEKVELSTRNIVEGSMTLN